MRTLSVAEIKALGNKEPIPSFTGKIVHVWDQKTGDGQYGPWWLQNLDVEDTSGTIKVTWMGEDAFDQGVVGKLYSFECTETKNGLKGVSWEVKKKDGKTYENVRVTPQAKIKLVSSDTSNWPEAKLSQEAPAQAPQSPLMRSDEMAGVQEAREHLMASANLYWLCIECTEKFLATKLPEVAHTSEQFQSTLASLWIEASSRRSTDGKTWWSYIDMMPSTPLKK